MKRIVYILPHNLFKFVGMTRGEALGVIAYHRRWL
jgi:hypothetical protein